MKTKRKGTKAHAVIMTECPECQGEGEVPASCEVCNVTLTTDNVVKGSDDLCKKCEAEGA